jgi:hypothetical protein
MRDLWEKTMTEDHHSIEQRFTEELVALFRKWHRITSKMGDPWRAARYLQAVRTHGGVEAMRIWLKRGDTVGSQRAAELGLADLTAEAIALRYPFSSLFTEEELIAIDRRLREMQDVFRSDYELDS